MPGQQLVQAGCRRAHHFQLHPRVQARKALQQVRQEHDGIVVRATEAQHARQLLAAQFGQGFVVIAQQLPRAHEQPLAGGRERHASPGAMQQRLLHDAFEPLHLHAERRLRAPHAQRCLAQHAGLRDGDKAAKQVDVQGLAHGMNSPDS